jgi:hypothetical protein
MNFGKLQVPAGLSFLHPVVRIGIMAVARPGAHPVPHVRWDSLALVRVNTAEEAECLPVHNHGR